MESAINKKTKRLNQRKKKQIVFFTSLVILPLIQFAICYIYVNFNSFILAFQKYTYKKKGLGFDITFAGFDNFKTAWSIISERSFMLTNSLQLFFWTTIVGLTLALLFSYYIYKKYPMAEFFRVILFMPKIVSGVVFALLYKYIANDVFMEVMNNMLHIETNTGLIDNPDTRLGAVLFYCVWISEIPKTLQQALAWSKLKSRLP